MWGGQMLNAQHQRPTWSALTSEEKKTQLFLQQKHTLDLFLERGAISKEQYNKSLGDLRNKMGFKDKK